MNTPHHYNEATLSLTEFHPYWLDLGIVLMAEAEVRVALQQSIHEKIAEDILYAGERRYEAGLREGEHRGERRGERVVNAAF